MSVTLNGMGAAADALGLYKNALQWIADSLGNYSQLKKALYIYEKVLCTRVHRRVATTLNNIGASLTIKVQVYGTKVHSDVAATLNNMESAADSQGQYAAALGFYEALTGRGCTQTSILNNMGAAEENQDDHEAALQYCRESLEIKEKLFRTRLHPDVAMSLCSIGNI
ncbi:hypothetical protein DFJ73DRAFT_779584 [Zopfochytrium polystomum]|nr:hypothetical protein DFJ73DRAFT_779584 [Zopfochytrium polystomum]